MSPTPTLPPAIPVTIVAQARPGRRSAGSSTCAVPVHSWQCALPGDPYRGTDPDGFLARDEIVTYPEALIASFDPPVISGVEVRALAQEGGAFLLDTLAGRLRAGQVVVATGG